jgi:hypothetical protein
MLLLERGRFDVALERCADLEPLAAKLGDGSELPFARTLLALAKFARGHGDAAGAVEQALAGLRAIDTKGHLAYALNFMANLDLAAGNLANAKSRAEEALGAADVVGRRTEVARARTVLAEIALRMGDPQSASAHLDALQEDIERPLAVADTTRRAALRLLSQVEAVPTSGATAMASASAPSRKRPAP